MTKAKVFFTDFRTKLDVSQGVKLQKLCRKAGLGQVDFEGNLSRSSCTSGSWAILPIFARTM